MRTLLMSAFLILTLSACGAEAPTGSATEAAPTGSPGAEGTVGDAPDCVCEKGKAGAPIWCKACDKGYVDGEPADCPNCVKKAQKKLEESE